MLQENTYVVSDDTREAVIIDCGALYDEEHRAIADYIASEGLKPVRLLSTHGHFDHNLGNAAIWRQYGLRPEVSAPDASKMDLRQQVLLMLGIDLPVEQAPTGPLISAGDVISFGTHQLVAMPTPGHSPGSMTFYCQSASTAFTGDTLFRMSIGRTDFEGGSWTDMQHSLTQILAMLPDDTHVYPGHGEATTIGDEKRWNPYMR